MDITTSGSNPCTVKLAGRFDANECEFFGTKIDEVKEAGQLDLRVDLSSVDFIDSSALASLVSLSRWASTHKRLFELLDPSDPVRVILEITGLDRALTIQISPVASS